MALGPSLPLVYDDTDRIALIHTVSREIKQNFLILLLTLPGERVMEPDFGVGISRYLFLNFSESVDQKIKQKIKQQVKMFMPSIKLGTINFAGDIEKNNLSMRITYSLPNLGVQDLIEFTI